MPQETVGYVELEWSCRSCGAVNKGTQKTCKACGAAMSDDQEFTLPGDAPVEPVPPAAPDDAPAPSSGETSAPAADRVSLTGAAATGALGTAAGSAGAQPEPGPDIHCAFCGARNLASAARCSQCGADLKQGKARQSGRVVGALRGGAAAPAKPVAKPSGLTTGCLVLIALLVIGAIAFFALSARTTELIGVVQGVEWERKIAVMEQRPVQRETWRDQVPSGATLLSCTQRERRIQDEPAPGAQKVCGTEYVVDQGTGKGKVVQDCRYRIMADSCKYTVLEWQAVSELTRRGSDLNPTWPALNLSAGQRAGDRSEKYAVTFTAGDKRYQYSLADAAQLSSYKAGSRWTLKVNGLGAVTQVSPAR